MSVLTAAAIAACVLVTVLTVVYEDAPTGPMTPEEELKQVWRLLDEAMELVLDEWSGSRAIQSPDSKVGALVASWRELRRKRFALRR